jgi:nucleotide-binding universal stress UspA family protein
MLGAMFSQIVVGVDGRAGGRDAMALAERLLAPGGSLILTHVLVGGGVRSTAALLAEEEEKLVAEIRATSLAPDIGGEVICVRSSSPGRGLHERAERARADLVVVGSCRRSLLGRVVIGDDTRAALNGAPCAVAVAPTGYANQVAAIHKIGVAYNGSSESIHALDTARALASELHASLSAFEAVSLPVDPYTGGVAAVDAEAIEQIVAEARESIAELGGVEPHAAYGFPPEELGLYSASVDLLVVGSRGYGPVGRLIHGSTSQQLARTARCPLLVLARSIDTRDVDDDLHITAAKLEVAQDDPSPRRSGPGYDED